MWVVGAATTTRSTRPDRSISWAALRPKVVLPAAGVAEARKLSAWWPARFSRASVCHRRSGRSAGHGGSERTARRAATPVLTRGSPFLRMSGRRRGGPGLVRARKGRRGGGRKRGGGRGPALPLAPVRRVRERQLHVPHPIRLDQEHHPAPHRERRSR